MVYSTPSNVRSISPQTPAYGVSLPFTITSGSLFPSSNQVLGVTTDPLKSGLITTFSNLTLGTVPSEKLGGFYIRY